ncbi:hypothetical protein PARHAE_03268 [Paracoccus haematequi]|uniref:Uncharacterized protein n=1 Tax=Paracoccus haematequi TaxID=2491866 RepID=A0A447IRD2_9RHOB|nr:hypothetical protein [Paracoccus haematequi]VDS10057.1 hypothetical protein PARHAE_03268 [Paracoccus haematequi]
MLTPELYFFLMITAAMIVKLMNPPVSSLREGVSAMLSSYLCAYVGTAPAVTLLGRFSEGHEEAATLLVGVLMALTGFKIVQTIIRLSTEVSATITPSKMLKIVDLLISLRTGALPPSRQLPPPEPAQEPTQEGRDNVQS